ncbi:hypothetical protein M8J76_006091 [Diaphorina citri]|nr:hypothetical protein M8J76_006091 [Diaphorina citri]
MPVSMDIRYQKMSRCSVKMFQSMKSSAILTLAMLQTFYETTGGLVTELTSFQTAYAPSYQRPSELYPGLQLPETRVIPGFVTTTDRS